MLNDEPTQGTGDTTPTTTDSDTATISALAEQIAVLTVAHEAKLSELLLATEEAHQAKAAHEEAQAQLLLTHRRALLAENAGQLVPELVRGDTQEELESSVAPAREAYDRILKAAQAELAEARAQVAAQVPAGASGTAPPPAENLSPLQKISQALSRNNR